jgi:phospholipase/carboxylesterase
MNRWALFLFVCVFPVAAQEKGDDKLDIYKVKPEQIGGADARALVAEAFQAYNEKRYEDSARLYIRALRMTPGDSTSLYNLACCYGLLGHEEQATAFLKSAWNAGFRDLEHIRNDPDFDKVEESEGFKELLAKLAEDAGRRKRFAGKRLEVAVPVIADVRVVEPDKVEPRKRYPVLIGLHGLGDNGESFAGLFGKREIAQDFLFVVAPAPYALNVGGRVGYSWHLRGPEVETAVALHSHRYAMHYVLKVLEAVRRDYLVDERNVFLMGFSQGAGLAASVGMRQPGLFKGVIPIGGWFEPAEFTEAELEGAAKRGRFLICHSPEDQVVPFDTSRRAASFLAEHDIPFRLVRYQGGHTLPKDLMESIAAWMRNPTISAAKEATPPEGR